jgi:hypothetical protein
VWLQNLSIAIRLDRAHEIPLWGVAMSIVEECPRIGQYVFFNRTERAGEDRRHRRGESNRRLSRSIKRKETEQKQEQFR